MPSPFPGMDPYLEGSFWLSVHAQLCSEIVRQLGPRLHPRYVALPTRRFVLERSEGVNVEATAIYPDAAVIRSAGWTPGEGGGGVATAPVRAVNVLIEEVPHLSVEIRDVQGRRLVASIEVLSPTNKRGSGYDEYLAKRQEILRSSAHLLEIDLLHHGLRVPLEGALPAAPYFVILSRANDRPGADVWPIAPNQPLPTVPVPLLDGDPDVPLDLQAAFQTVYETCGFDLLIDYTRPPEVPLSPAEAAWVDELLRAAGLRS